MSIRFLAVQTTYTHLEIAIAHEQGCIATRTCHKKDASKDFIITLSALLEETNTKLKDLVFLAANRGPGPFTTLRTALASINGLGLATGLPLIGIDGLIAGVQELANNQYPINVYILNAFAGDVYFGIRQNSQITTGYSNAESLFNLLATRAAYATMEKQTIYLFGEGVTHYQEIIMQTLGTKAIIAHPLPHTSSIEYIAQSAYSTYNAYQTKSSRDLSTIDQNIDKTIDKNNSLYEPLLPLYLKAHHFSVTP